MPVQFYVQTSHEGLALSCACHPEMKVGFMSSQSRNEGAIGVGDGMHNFVMTREM